MKFDNAGRSFLKLREKDMGVSGDYRLDDGVELAGLEHPADRRGYGDAEDILQPGERWQLLGDDDANLPSGDGGLYGRPLCDRCALGLLPLRPAGQRLGEQPVLVR